MTARWLLVEDDPVDRMTLERALAKVGADVELIVATDAYRAWEYLDVSRPELVAVPSLVLVDVNLPIRSGHELLADLKSHPEWRGVPVVVLTTSDHDADTRQAFEGGAAGYFVKPPEFKKFVEVVRAIVAYWSQSRIAPPRRAEASL